MIAMSLAKPYFANSAQPSRSIVSGSARNVFDTKPPNVADAQAATNSDEERDAERDLAARRDRA